MKKEFKQFALCLTEDEIGEALIKVLHKKPRYKIGAFLLLSYNYLPSKY